MCLFFTVCISCVLHVRCVVLCCACICIIIPREIKRMNSGNMHILSTNREFIVQKKYSKRTIPGETEKKFGMLSFFPHSSYLSLSLHLSLSHPWWKFHHHTMFMKFIYLWNNVNNFIKVFLGVSIEFFIFFQFLLIS